MGNGTTTAHKQIAASILNTRAGQVAIINADTDLTPYDTGTFASTGTVVAGKAVGLAAETLRDAILDYAARHTGVDRAACRLEADHVLCGNRRIRLTALHAAGSQEGFRFIAFRKSYLSPRTVAFNVQGIRLAVHRGDRGGAVAAQRACGRCGAADQPDAGARPDRRGDRHGGRLDADREDAA